MNLIKKSFQVKVKVKVRPPVEVSFPCERPIVDVSCLAVFWSLRMMARMTRLIRMMMEDVNVNLEPGP